MTATPPDRTELACTPWLLAPVVVAVVLALAAPRGGGLLWYAAAAALGTVAGALLVRPRLAGLAVEVLAPSRSVAGRPVEHVVRVHNSGTRASSAATLRLQARGWPDLVLRIEALPAGGSVVLRGTRLPTAARAWEAEPVLTLRSTEPLGLLRATCTWSLGFPLVVHPDVAADAGPRRSRSAPEQAGELSGLREWRAGDSLRQVSARHSARRGVLVTVTREQPDQRPLAVVLGGSPDFEAVVRLAARHALDALRDGRRVTLVDASTTLPRDLLSTRAVLDACAAATGPAGDPGLQAARTWAARAGEVLLVRPGPAS